MNALHHKTLLDAVKHASDHLSAIVAHTHTEMRLGATTATDGDTIEDAATWVLKAVVALRAHLDPVLPILNDHEDDLAMLRPRIERSGVNVAEIGYTSATAAILRLASSASIYWELAADPEWHEWRPVDGDLSRCSADHLRLNWSEFCAEFWSAGDAVSYDVVQRLHRDAVAELALVKLDADNRTPKPEPDGPAGDGGWRYRGELKPGLSAQQFRLCKAVYEAPGQVLHVDRVGEATYPDCHGSPDRDNTKDTAKAANKWFKNEAQWPCRIRYSGGELFRWEIDKS